MQNNSSRNLVAIKIIEDEKMNWKGERVGENEKKTKENPK